MTLGILLALGDSFEDMAKVGQDGRFIKYYLKSYSKAFDKVYVFTYGKLIPKKLPKNIIVITNSNNLHRYIFGLILPFKFYSEFTSCNTIRAFHLSGTVPAILGKIFLNKPYIFNYAYDYKKDADLGGKYLQSLTYNCLAPLSFYFASKIFISNQYFLNQFKSEKTYYLPNGVDTNLFKPSKQKKPNKIPVILSIGRLEVQKNYLELTKALNGIKCKFLLVGNGSLKQNISTLAKKTNINLEIINKLSNAKLPKIYNQCDIFILPSLTEGHPKVLIEAMACGMPVIGSNVGGIPDLIKNNKTGLLCKTDENSIKKTIIKLLNQSKLQKSISLGARKFIVQNCNLKKIMEDEIMNLKNI